MQEVYKAIGRVAGQNINVLIRGESGTGKELVARAIHQHSNRAGKKFLAVNCAAIPESLLESELFGHEKGSFTGAVSQRIGKFEECDGGTLFLDEVGDMPLLMQSKVLRAIQEKEFQRVGGNQTIKSDACIVAATNRDLDAMVVSGEFRADLSLSPERLHDRLAALARAPRRHPAPGGLLPSPLQFRDRQSDNRRCAGSDGTLEAVFLAGEYPRIADRSQACHVARDRAYPGAGVPSAGVARGQSACFRPTVPAAAARGHARQRGNRHEISAEGHGDVAFRAFIANQLRSGTRSLYAESVKYMERILLTDVLSHTNGNQSQAALLLGITRGCLRSKLRMHGMMISSSVAVQSSAR